MKKRFLFCLLALAGCIETDLVEDVVTVFIIKPVNKAEPISLLVDEKTTFMIVANSEGGEFNPDGDWKSSNTNVATVNQDGEVTAIGDGVAVITATNFGLTSNGITVSVVDNADEVAAIQIKSPGNSSTIVAGATLQLSADALNVRDEVINDVTIEWSSSDESVATVDATGLVTAVADGSVDITAAVEERSAIFSLTVGEMPAETSREGSFKGKGSYTVKGTATVSEIEGGALELNLGSDFTTSNGPGLYLYLSNSDGSVTNSVKLGKLRSTSGADKYDIPNGVTLDQYDFVLVWCEPFGLTFGYAELN